MKTYRLSLQKYHENIYLQELYFNAKELYFNDFFF